MPPTDATNPDPTANPVGAAAPPTDPPPPHTIGDIFANVGVTQAVQDYLDNAATTAAANAAAHRDVVKSSQDRARQFSDQNRDKAYLIHNPDGSMSMVEWDNASPNGYRQLPLVDSLTAIDEPAPAPGTGSPPATPTATAPADGTSTADPALSNLFNAPAAGANGTA